MIIYKIHTSGCTIVAPSTVNRCENPTGVHTLVINTPNIDIQEYKNGTYENNPLISYSETYHIKLLIKY